jgi:large subunit ribosomal protein L5
MSTEQDNQKQPQGPQGQAPGAPESKPQGDQRPKGEGKPQGERPKGEGKPGKPKEGRPGKDQKGAKGAGDGKGEKGGPVEPIVAPRLRDLYRGQVRQQIAEKFGIKNPMAMPRLEKITLNVNMGRHLDGNKIPPNVRTTVVDTLTKVTGQRPVVLKAKKSVANFKVREGMETAAMVTLRRDRMWHFLDRFVNLATPRIKDFRGLPRNSFDGQGNYSCGVTEQGVFPEINMAEAQFTHGMHINITFSGSNADLSRFVLESLGMPFAKEDAVKVEKKKKKRKKKPPAEAAAASAA